MQGPRTHIANAKEAMTGSKVSCFMHAVCNPLQDTVRIPRAVHGCWQSGYRTWRAAAYHRWMKLEASA